MEQKTHKKVATYSLSLFFLFVFVGLFLLYKGAFSTVKLKKIDGIVLSSSHMQTFGKYTDDKRSHNILLIEVQGINKILGIYAGTVEQAEKLSKELSLVAGTEYSFLVDTTLVSPIDVYPGVRTIKLGNETVYQDTNINSQTFFGWLTLSIAIVIGLYYYSFRKKKFES
ncbi:hypothetical protein [Kordia sp.]|uniref:hypothetical protein n=1 Tax=Kordia sp. TaxID=1965332 RepID=UPI003B5A5879